MSKSKKRPGVVIGIANMKGGVGKTTIAQTMAMFFMEHTDRKRVALVDADPQRSSLVWHGVAERGGHARPRIKSLGGPDVMLQELEELRQEVDVVVIDGPARLGPATRAAMMASDVLLMPIMPGVADVWALQDTLAELKAALVRNPDLIVRVVMNRMDKTVFARDIEASLGKVGLEVMAARLVGRVAFSQAMAAGRSVLGQQPKSKAAVEARRLGREVEKLLPGALESDA